jgi:hypothetical protein
MKRKKHSIPTIRVSQRCNKAKGKGKVDYDDDDTQNHQLCPYFANIPSHIPLSLFSFVDVSAKIGKHKFQNRISLNCTFSDHQVV